MVCLTWIFKLKVTGKLMITIPMKMLVLPWDKLYFRLWVIKKGIVRFGNFLAPLDEALVQVALDFSGRPHLSYGLEIPTQRVGNYDTQLVREFFVALVNHSQMTLHIRQLDGINSHHIIEATFKAFARAMRIAVEVDPRRAETIPSSKGVL